MVCLFQQLWGMLVQEYPVLNSMEYVLSRKRGGWREGYYATASDIGVVEFNKWLERYGGGRPDWESGEPGPIPLMPIDKLFSPYEQHAKDCSICKKVCLSPCWTLLVFLAPRSFPLLSTQPAACQLVVGLERCGSACDFESRSPFILRFSWV